MADQVTEVGSTAVIQCMTTGSPRPTLTWLKDGVVIVATPRHYFTASDQLLVIVQTAVTDTGNYTCITTNVLGSDRQVTHLLIISGSTLSIILGRLHLLRRSWERRRILKTS